MFSLLLGVALSAPKRYPGFLWGPEDASVNIEAYVDPLCPDCLAIWPSLMAVVSKYPTQINLRVHMVNLPYHTWSYYTVWAVYVLNSIDSQKAKEMIDALFTGDQNMFSNSALKDVAQSDIPATFANYASKKYSVDYQTFLDGFSNTDVSRLASQTFGFGAQKGIDGTPTIFINGVATDMDSETPISTWTQVIDELLA